MSSKANTNEIKPRPLLKKEPIAVLVRASTLNTLSERISDAYTGIEYRLNIIYVYLFRF